MSLGVIACDKKPVSSRARYVLLKPGWHELWFSITGQSMLKNYRLTRKKFIEVAGGRTYILKTSGVSPFYLSSKWYIDVVDVTDDSMLHITNVSDAQELRYD